MFKLLFVSIVLVRSFDRIHVHFQPRESLDARLDPKTEREPISRAQPSKPCINPVFVKLRLRVRARVRVRVKLGLGLGLS